MDRLLDNQKVAKRRYPRLPRRIVSPKIIILLSTAAVLLGAVFLVYQAVTAPVMPQGNIISTLQEMREYYTDPENSYSLPLVVLPPEDGEWAQLTAFEERETGAGAGTEDRSEDIEYKVRPGETLSEIAYSYKIPYSTLAYYNNITNANRIRVGTVILIPSVENTKAAELQMARQPRRTTAAVKTPAAKTAKIGYEIHNSGSGNAVSRTVRFSIIEPQPETLQSFEWDFGDGKRGFQASPSYEYTVPKTYVARLTARDSAGTIYRSNSLFIDVPYPSSVAEYNTTRFVTLSSPNDYFVVNGSITSVARYASVEAAPLDFSESDQFLTKVRFTRPGYYGITVDERGISQYYSVFVSPLPSMHADVADGNFNWYRTQFNTGTTSNCGPASTSMAIGWSLGKYFPVSSVRQAVGWQGDGGTGFEELQKVIRDQGVPSVIKPLRSLENIKEVIDSGDIAIILFRTDGVRSTRKDPNTDLFGKYYTDSVGHYIVVKGYSLNGEYLVIHDPIPSDWGANSFRYGDEVSMIGRNRYYPTTELLKSLRRADMIVVSRPEKS